MLLIHGDGDRFRDLPERPDTTRQRHLLIGAAGILAGTIELVIGSPVTGVLLEGAGIIMVGSSGLMEYAEQ